MKQQPTPPGAGEVIELGQRAAHTRYCFRTAQLAPKSALDAVARCYDAAVRSAAFRLEVYLEAPLRAAPSVVEQSTFGQYAVKLQRPLFLASLRLKPDAGQAVLCLSSELIAGFLGLMLGGEGGNGGGDTKQFTAIEVHMLEAVIQIVTRELRAGSAPLADLTFEFGGAESEPEQCRIGQTDLAVIATAELQVRGTAGRIALAIPSATIRAITLATGKQRRLSSSDAAQGQMPRLAKLAEVRADVRLEESRILVGDLLQLRPGQVLSLPHPVGRPMDLAINGVPKFKGQVVDSGHTLGFQVAQLCEETL